MNKVFKIRGSVKQYAWGKIGSHSIVARLQESAFRDFTVETETPYAELWIGTHVSGPAQIPSLQEMQLIDWIQNHPECLGKSIANFYDTNKGLPFLFKVLSVNKPLSIQVHPDKETAARLHEQFPDHYPDDNHKPEMAIAISDFEALCGFRPLSEIKHFLMEIPHFKTLIREDIFQSFIKSPSRNNLKCIFTNLMTCQADSIQSQFTDVVECFQKDVFKCKICQSMGKLFLEIAEQYPSDIGCFCLFFLNYVTLKPGEAIYLAANEPHAYLFGDCIECMACSDNVVRAGLTPKFKDVETLCAMLTYNCKSGSEAIFPFVCDPNDQFLKIYNPPAKEFVIDVIELPISSNVYSVRNIDSASVLLVLKGRATYKSGIENSELCTGSILFISSGCIVDIEPKMDMVMYRAHCSK